MEIQSTSDPAPLRIIFVLLAFAEQALAQASSDSISGRIARPVIAELVDWRCTLS